jgi:hypothetical protein
MPTGTIKSLRKVEIGVEATPGTAVAATEQLFMIGEFDPDYPVARGETPIGVMVRNAGPTALTHKLVPLTLRSDPNVGATYEQLAWLLALAMKVAATTGAGPYVHTFAPGVSVWTPKTATVRGRWSDGTNNEDLRFEYFTGSKLHFKGDENGALQVELEGFARQMTDEAISGAALPATLTPILLSQAMVYINDSFALADVHAPVAGRLAKQMKSWSLDVDIGQYPEWNMEGSLLFAQAEQREKSWDLSMTTRYESNAANAGVAAERVKAATVPQPFRFVTIAFTGPGNMKLRLVLAGKHEKGEIGPPKAEADGRDTIDWKLMEHYDPTGVKLVKAVLTNDDSAAL